VVKLLLEKGAELEAKTTYGQTPLSRAAGNGHEAVVKLLLEKGAELETKDKNGWTPLSCAAKNGHEAVVKLLLEIGAELEAVDNDGQTPLSWAAKNGYEAVVKLLLEKGAELEAKNKYGQTPLSRASQEEEWGEGVKVSRAPGYVREAVVKLLLEKGVELLLEKGEELLLEKGVELETKDKDGQTPLSRAAEKGRSLSFDAIGTGTNNPCREGRVRRGYGFRAFRLRTTLLSVCTYNAWLGLSSFGATSDAERAARRQLLVNYYKIVSHHVLCRIVTCYCATCYPIKITNVTSIVVLYCRT
jgi:ankyrin repeat protein